MFRRNLHHITGDPLVYFYNKSHLSIYDIPLKRNETRKNIGGYGLLGESSSKHQRFLLVWNLLVLEDP
uniref:Uncharacterized protein n=1 Tax=Utricularia reniformis TaxID=192314 RepID=A0A1Y0AYW3_9LAMI|nr:hypothetical protein AEK19_MT1005 [Utricularia reniformis]ART30340.1 hypothetical protein AEK19_MT1005 [Utricularia reniformis]